MRLQVRDMADYLDALATALKGGAARHPLKIIVAGIGDDDDDKCLQEKPPDFVRKGRLPSEVLNRTSRTAVEIDVRLTNPM